MAVRKSNSEELNFEFEPPVTHYLSTGCTILDLAIADRLPGGFGAGRISHIVGPESSAKSVLVAEPLGSAQRQGGKAYLVDAETTFDMDRARDLFGVNVGELKYYGTEDDLTIEYLFDGIFRKVLKRCEGTEGPNVIGIDSLSSITSEIEADEAMDEKTYGQSRPKSLSKGFRRDLRKFNKANLGLIFIDQTRQNITGRGKAWTFSGGEALKFYASTRLYVKKDADILNKHKKVVGAEFYFKVDKNKIAPPYRDGVFSLMFDYGIDDIRTNLNWLKENTVSEGGKASSWFKIPGTDKQFNSMVSAIKHVEENNLEDVLVKEVYRVWREVYHRIDRKVKAR